MVPPVKLENLQNIHFQHPSVISRWQRLHVTLDTRSGLVHSCSKRDLGAILDPWSLMGVCVSVHFLIFCLSSPDNFTKHGSELCSIIVWNKINCSGN